MSDLRVLAPSMKLKKSNHAAGDEHNRMSLERLRQADVPGLAGSLKAD